MICDSEDRERLLTSYTKDACFNMTPFDPHNPIEDRNLCGSNSNVNFSDNMQKLVKRGRCQSLRFSTKCYELPNILTLTINISLISKGMTLATVAGMFKELDEIEQSLL